MLAVHPAYEVMFSGFFPAGLTGNDRTNWAAGELRKCLLASSNLGLHNVPVLSGGFAWHLTYPWPQRPPRIVEEAFQELGRRWRPLLDLAADKNLVFGFELHPGSDLLRRRHVRDVSRRGARPSRGLPQLRPESLFCCKQLDYLAFIEIYGRRIKGFHVKDAEFRPSGRVGVYGGYQPWSKAGRPFRSLGDGQVDFKRVFTCLRKRLSTGWAVLEECCVKSPHRGGRGAVFIGPAF